MATFPIRLAYKIAPTRRLTTERVLRVAREHCWPLCQPDAEYVDDYNGMTTLEIDTHLGPVVLRKRGRNWALMEITDPSSKGDVALIEAIDDEHFFVPDFERSTNYN